MPRLTLPLAVTILVLAVAASARADTGRVSFTVGLPAPGANVDVAGATAAAALPGGGAVLVGDEPGRGLVAAAIDADGRLEPGFGSRGVSHVRVGDGFQTLRVLVRPDGRLLVAGTVPAAKRLQLPELVLVGLTPAGRLDASFGDGGVARPGIQGSCANCNPVALAPDGSIVATGNTGSISPAIAHDPDAPDTFTWVVTRLTADGRPDPAFGTRQVPGTAIGRSGGYAVALAADGRITLVGRNAERDAAVRLLPDGTADPSFASGAPAAVPSKVALDFVLGDDGSVTALGLRSASRLRPDGTRDAGFGDGGVVRLGGMFARLLAIGGGEVLVYRPQVQARAAAEPALVVHRLDVTGRRSTQRLHLPFGGGAASSYRRAAWQPALDQNAFRGAALLPRPGGGYLAAGGVTLQQFAGEGEGWSTATFAAAALTPDLRLDRSYGPSAARVTASVRLIRQRARSARKVRGVAVRIRATRPGLMRVRIRDRAGRTLARSVEPLYRAGTARVRIPLTAFGRRALGDRRVKIAVEARFRDLLAAEDAAPRVRGTLR
jgi:uncharacterized delta-60 repeat protein